MTLNDLDRAPSGPRGHPRGRRGARSHTSPAGRSPLTLRRSPPTTTPSPTTTRRLPRSRRFVWIVCGTHPDLRSPYAPGSLFTEAF